jgi:Zn-dependent protease with chaperone function/Flp pilus assembly protein TadD
MIKLSKPNWKFYLLFTCMLFSLAGCVPSPALTPATQATQDPNEEKVFEKQLQAINPAAIPVYREAKSQYETGEFQKSEQLYKQVINMVPDFATAYRRLGYIEFYQNNNRESAISLLRKAVELEPDSYNQSTLALFLVLGGTPIDNQEAFTLSSVAVQLKPDDEQANVALLLASANLNNMTVARQADQTLLDVAPNSPIAHYFSGLFAATDKKWEKADAELRTAQALGMPADMVQEALNGGISRNVALIRFLRWGGIASIFWLIGLGMLFLAGTFLSNATIHSLSKLEPNIGAQLQPSERVIRSIYRIVIIILSIYFYISIPFVVLLLLIVVGGAFYLFFLIGTIPIKLAIILVFMLFASIYAILHSILKRKKELPPGRLVSRADAPELWKMIEQVASKIETRPVDAIYLTPFTGIAVNERSGILKKLRKSGKRNLILGMGVLSGLNQGQFASILAHEYGHFYNRDTAGGDLAYRVIASLNQMAIGMAQSGASQAFNPAWLFIIAYQKIYLRVTMGASRLQEVLADRFATMAYGKNNFVEGLKNIIRQTLAFQLHANFEVRRSFELNQPINNLYQLPLQEDLHGELETMFDSAMKQKTSTDDSHPSPLERFALIDRMRIPYAFEQDNALKVLDLFANPEGLQQEMTAELMKNVRVIRVPA